MLRGQRGARGAAEDEVAALRPQPTIETIDSGRRDYPIRTSQRPWLRKAVQRYKSVTGIGYFQRSVVYFNGIPVPTRFVNANELQAQVDEVCCARLGATLVVRNAGRRPAETRRRLVEPRLADCGLQMMLKEGL